MRLIRSLSAMLLVLALAFTGRAALSQDQEPLTDREVEAFIASYPAAKELAEKYKLDERTRPQSGAGPTQNEVFGGVIDEMKAAGAYSEFESLVENHGFESAEEWVEVANRIMMAYAVMSAEDAQGGGRVDEDVARQIAEARRQIETSDMPPDQKQAALGQIEAMAGQMKMLEVSEADREAVRPHMAELDRLVETE